MFEKDQFLSTVELETTICKHVNDKLSGDQLTYRPAEGMRSTLELLQYLTYCGIGPAHALVTGDWEAMKGRVEAAKSVTAAGFGDSMDAQAADLRSLVEPLGTADLRDRRVTLPGGAEASLGHALVWAPLRFLTAYRMQLFVYAKSSGSNDLSTINCWYGIDPPAQG